MKRFALAVLLVLMLGACDLNGDGFIDCFEDPNPDPVTDIPCGFRDGIPV